jgi:hypothetical protein
MLQRIHGLLRDCHLVRFVFLELLDELKVPVGLDLEVVGSVQLEYEPRPYEAADSATDRVVVIRHVVDVAVGPASIARGEQ